MSQAKNLPAVAATVAEDHQYLTFLLSSELFAIPILNIKEIIEFGSLTEVPMMPGFIRGVINLRGSVVPVVDLSVRFGRGKTEVSRRTCIVIIEVEGIEEISMRLQSKFIKAAEPKAKADAIEAEHRGDKGKQDKADRTLKFVKKLELKRMFPESVESLEAARQHLQDHVTNSIPSTENITKMHDLVKKVQDLGGSGNAEYNKISDNECCHQKYRDAADE